MRARAAAPQARRAARVFSSSATAQPVAFSIITCVVRTVAARSPRLSEKSTRKVTDDVPTFSTSARVVICSPGRRGRKNSASARRSGEACVREANQPSQPTAEYRTRFSTAA